MNETTKIRVDFYYQCGGYTSDFTFDRYKLAEIDLEGNFSCFMEVPTKYITEDTLLGHILSLFDGQGSVHNIIAVTL